MAPMLKEPIKWVSGAAWGLPKRDGGTLMSTVVLYSWPNLTLTTISQFMRHIEQQSSNIIFEALHPYPHLSCHLKHLVSHTKSDYNTRGIIFTLIPPYIDILRKSFNSFLLYSYDTFSICITLFDGPFDWNALAKYFNVKFYFPWFYVKIFWLTYVKNIYWIVLFKYIQSAQSSFIHSTMKLYSTIVILYIYIINFIL